MRWLLSKKLWGYVLVFVLAYGIFLLATAPARLITTHLLPGLALQPPLQAENASGSLWDGELGSVKYAHLNLGRVSWQLSVLPLMTGQLDVAFRFQGEENKGRGSIAVDLQRRLAAENLYLSLPAGQLVPFVPMLKRFRIDAGGEVQGSLQSARIEPGERLNVRGRVVWRDARLLVPYNMDLGHFVATLEPQDRGTRIRVDDDGGPVMLEATLSVEGDGAYDLRARLKARDESQQHITSALRTLGRADGQGWHTLNQKGVLPNWRAR